MSRIRTIKPDFFFDEAIADLKPLARLLYIGLWTLADREGRLEDKPRQIKALIFPFNEINIDTLLKELQQKPFIIRYETEGKKLIWIKHFLKHQRPHHTEAKSVLPGLNGELTVKQPLDNGEAPVGKEGKGKEGKGKEGTGENAKEAAGAAMDWQNLNHDIQKLIAYYVKGEMPELYRTATVAQANELFSRHGKAARTILNIARDLQTARRAFDLSRAYYNGKNLSWTLDTVAKNIGEFVNQAIQEKAR